MAITKRNEIDKIEIVGPNKVVQFREITIIEKGGVELGRSAHRTTLNAGSVDASGAFIDTDLTGQTQEIVDISTAAWTPAVKNTLRIEGLSERISDLTSSGSIAEAAVLQSLLDAIIL
jgi:hypothetical protein